MVFAASGAAPRERFLSKWWLLGISWMAVGLGVHAQTTGLVHFTSSQRELPMIAQNPTGIAVDREGNIFVVDQATGTVTEDKLSADSYTSHVVLTGLKSPTAIAVDLQGNLYITEDARYRSGPTDVVRASKPSNDSETTYTATVIPTTGLGLPAGIALDRSGSIYVADSLSDRIIKLAPSANGYVQSALFTGALLQPSGVTVDADGAIYIADTGHARVLKETVSGNGYSQSVVTSQDFSLDFTAFGVAVDTQHNVLVLAELSGQPWPMIERPDGPAYSESNFMVANILAPTAIAADGHGSFYAVGPGNNQLVKISSGAGDAGPANLVTTGLPISMVFTSDKDGATVGSVAVTSQNFSDAGTGRCNQYGGYIDLAGESCNVDVIFKPYVAGILNDAVTLHDPAGNSLASGYVHGTGLAPSLQFPAAVTPIYGVYAHPTGVATDKPGNFYFTETGTGTVWDASVGYHFGISINAVATGLTNPMAVAVGPSGEIYVAASNAVYKEIGGYPDYTYVQTKVIGGLDHLTGIAVDGSANLYLIASSSGDVRKEIPRNTGGYQQISLGYGIRNPSGIAADTLGNVFITDARQGVLYKETIQDDGSYKQGVVATGLDSPEGVAVDLVGSIYVAMPAAGGVDEYALQADGSYRRTVGVAALAGAWGVAVDSEGYLYITQNRGAGSVVITGIEDPPLALNFANTRVGSLSADSPKTITLRNAGNAPLIFEDTDLGSNPVVPAGFTLSNESTCLELGGVLPQGQTCTYAFDFLPQVRMAYADNAIITDNNYDSFSPNYAQQMILLSGLGVISDTTRTTMRISPHPVKAGLGVTMTIAVTDTTVSSATPTGGVTVNDTVGRVTTTLNGGAPLPLSHGKATLATSLSSPGTHTITAHYGGVNKNFSGSTFALTLTVEP